MKELGLLMEWTNRIEYIMAKASLKAMGCVIDDERSGTIELLGVDGIWRTYVAVVLQMPESIFKDFLEANNLNSEEHFPVEQLEGVTFYVNK